MFLYFRLYFFTFQLRFEYNKQITKNKCRICYKILYKMYKVQFVSSTFSNSLLPTEIN